MDTSASSRGGAGIRTKFMGALLKVTSKIKAEIDGDEEEEQRANELFERQWLGEFDRLRGEYQAKWDTCTHSADEFCGLLFHSSDEQQQAYLVREYPTLMEAWRDADLSSSSIRIRPDWPAARIARDAAVDYAPHSPTAEDPTQRVETSPSLRSVVSLLRTEFLWPGDAVHALTLRLEAEQVFSCAELLACMGRRRGAYFERAFQSRAYPRVTKPIARALRERALALEARHESVRDLSMEPLRVNPQ